MEKQKRKELNKIDITLLVIFAFFIIFLIVLLALRQNQDICEWWTINVAQHYFFIIGNLNSIFPFSMTEIFILFCILVILTLLILMIIYFTHHHFHNGFTMLAIILTFSLAVGTTYFATCGLAYGRKKINIELYEEKVEQKEFMPIIEYFVDDFNYCASTLANDSNGQLLCPYSLNELSMLLSNEYKKMDDYYYSYTPRGKPLLTSWFFTQCHIAGMSFSITGEPNVNIMNTQNDLGFSLAHEIAHQKGVMREEDANLLAAYICLNSEDEYLRYSGYNRTINSLISLANYTGDSNDIKTAKEMIDKRIVLDNQYSYEFWQKNNLAKEIGEFFNNLYLSLFGDGGIGSYDDNWDASDTGDVDEGGLPIYEISFSNYQKLFFEIYFERI